VLLNLTCPPPTTSRPPSVIPFITESIPRYLPDSFSVLLSDHMSPSRLSAYDSQFLFLFRLFSIRASFRLFLLVSLTPEYEMSFPLLAITHSSHPPHPPYERVVFSSPFCDPCCMHHFFVPLRRFLHCSI